MTKLGDLVQIRSGYTFRSSIDTFSDGDTEVIQAKDLNGDFGFAMRPKITFPGDEKHYLCDGEILLSARGFSRAVLFRGKGQKTVASSSIFVLTPKNNYVNPEFITMFFNSIQGVKAVLELSSGAAVRSITKKSLEKIIIPEIPPNKERALGKAVQAIDDELALITEKEIYLSHIRDTIISKTLKETAQ